VIRRTSCSCPTGGVATSVISALLAWRPQGT